MLISQYLISGFQKRFILLVKIELFFNALTVRQWCYMLTVNIFLKLPTLGVCDFNRSVIRFLKRYCFNDYVPKVWGYFSDRLAQLLLSQAIGNLLSLISDCPPPSPQEVKLAATIPPPPHYPLSQCNIREVSLLTAHNERSSLQI